MTDLPARPGPDDEAASPQPPRVSAPNTLTPLPGEPGIPHVATASPLRISRKSLFALGLLLVTLALGAGLWLHRWLDRFQTPRSPAAPTVSQQPAAATTPARRLDLSAPAASASLPPAAAPVPLIPALDPNAPLAEPIPVRRTGPSGGAGSGPVPMTPEDAPVLLLTSRPGAVTTPTPAPASDDPLAATRQRLEGYQRQLQGLLQNLETSAARATASPASAGATSFASDGPSPAARPASPRPGLLGGALPTSSTPRVAATSLGQRSLTLPKGTAFTCALKTKVVSANSGLVGCQVQRNVYSDDGRVLLIERGSHLDGEYRVAGVRPGTTRVPVIWTRVRTPLGVLVDLESPATGPLGESGLEGHVDNRWRERIGAALLVSLIDDAIEVVVQNQTNQRGGDAVVLGSTTDRTSELAEKVLDSTINIPPVITQHQGAIVGIYVARDVDFSTVYELQPGVR